MTITGLKSFVNFLNLNITQIKEEYHECHIPVQYKEVYIKCLGMEQLLNNLKKEIKDDRTKGYVEDCIESIKAYQNLCKPRFQ